MRTTRRSLASGLAGSVDATRARSSRAPAAWAEPFDGWALGRIRHELTGAPVVVRLWNGQFVAPGDGPPVASVLIRDRRTLVGLLLRPELAFGEAYTDGRIDVQGDLTQLFDATNRAVASQARRGSWLPAGAEASILPPWLGTWVSRALLGTAWTTRRWVIEEGFLHPRRPPLVLGVRP
ncbi:MAG: hypothetical protein ABI634_03045 [Acidobacteriota bacterium]